MQSCVVHGLGRILLFLIQRLVKQLQQIFLFSPHKKSSHALKEEEENTVQGNWKLAKIVFTIWETTELWC